jgi:hypothetical protein
LVEDDSTPDNLAVIKRAKEDFQKLEAEYNSSLSKKSIDPELKIDIKNFCGNLRSALDYLAHEIREKCCPGTPSRVRFYFPILPDHEQFSSKMAKWFPNLEKAYPEVWNYLESIQSYKANANHWLTVFNRLNNENKHGALTERTRTEIEQIEVISQGAGKVIWEPMGVTFGSGVHIGGVPVNPATQMPIPHPSQTVKRIVWVDFQFDGLGVSALNLLKQSLDGVETIVGNVFAFLEK